MVRTRTNPTYYDGDLRADLIAEALNVIVETGPASLTLRALSRRVGVSHAAPANHFPTKEALFGEIARQGFELLSSGLERAGRHESDPLRRLRRLGLAYLAFAGNHRGHFSVMFRRDLYDTSQIQAEADAAFDILVEACRAAQQHGWRSTARARGLATLLWSLVHGYAHLEAERGNLEIGRGQLISLFDSQLAS